MNATRLVMFRHAESASVAGRWISGESTCRGITDRGRDQAQALHLRLLEAVELRPDSVISSSMQRARETTTIITEDIMTTFEVTDGLVERRPGECEGMSYEEYEVRYGKPPWSDWRNPLSPGGESDETFVARVRSQLMQLLAAHEGETVWVVCHAGVLLAATHYLMKSDGSPSWGSPALTSLSEWYKAPGASEWTLQRYNDYGHLSLTLRPNF